MPHASAVIDEDPTLDALLGAQGSLAMRAMLHSFPQPIGLLWAKFRGDAPAHVAFRFTLPRQERSAA